MSSLQSTGSGMYNDAGNDGSDGDGNGNDVGTCGGKYSDDGRGGIGGATKHLARRSSAEGHDSEMSGDGTGSGGKGIGGSGDDNGVSGDGGGLGKARSLATSASNRNGI
ncbi:hypothetical protein Tco_0224882, partial [Tanacetum coccineum]